MAIESKDSHLRKTRTSRKRVKRQKRMMIMTRGGDGKSSSKHPQCLHIFHSVWGNRSLAVIKAWMLNWWIFPLQPGLARCDGSCSPTKANASPTAQVSQVTWLWSMEWFDNGRGVNEAIFIRWSQAWIFGPRSKPCTVSCNQTWSRSSIKTESRFQTQNLGWIDPIEDVNLVLEQPFDEFTLDFLFF